MTTAPYCNLSKVQKPFSKNQFVNNMKKLIILSALALVVFTNSSCQSEELQDTTATTKVSKPSSARIDVGNPHNTNTSGQYETIWYDKYIIQNNIWGSNPAWQNTWSAAGSGWWAYGVSSGHVNGTGSPKSFPSAVRGWVYGQWSNNSGLPRQVSGLNGCNFSWNTETPSTGRWNQILDIYFCYDNNPGGNKNKISCNILVQTNQSSNYYWNGWNQNNANQSVEYHTIDGVEYTVVITQDQEYSTGRKFPWINFHRKYGTNNMSNYNLKPLFDFCKNRGWIKTTDYLISIQNGWEIVDGNNGNSKLKSNSLSHNIW
jgi:hypothetical protein